MSESEPRYSCWSPIVLAVILLAGAYLRFTGLNWDEGLWIHPDESHMQQTTSYISIPDNLSLYFDTHHSPLNVRNTGHQYSYGTLPLFLTRLAAEWLDQACGESPDRLGAAVASLLLGPSEGAVCGPGTFTGSGSKLVGRALSALADLGVGLALEALALLEPGTAVIVLSDHGFLTNNERSRWYHPNRLLAEAGLCTLLSGEGGLADPATSEVFDEEAPSIDPRRRLRAGRPQRQLQQTPPRLRRSCSSTVDRSGSDRTRGWQSLRLPDA